MSSLQRRFGLRTDLTTFICHTVLQIVHLLSSVRAMCPAHFHFVSVTYWTMSVTLVLRPTMAQEYLLHESSHCQRDATGRYIGACLPGQQDGNTTHTTRGAKANQPSLCINPFGDLLVSAFIPRSRSSRAQENNHYHRAKGTSLPKHVLEARLQNLLVRHSLQ